MNQPTNDEKGKEEVVIVRLRESRMRKGGINPLPADPSPPPPPPPPQTPAEILLKGNLNSSPSVSPSAVKAPLQGSKVDDGQENLTAE